ncbi:Pollen-specific leucine-rich repeat extensin-like protein [Musa troglodytarum]|uniref:Pollen-specific leucine-rich repeat extensin-like protein n=1 Tax=Musa troglodytarum TaxID=320322 RepID=A0A9E7ENI5_9LILI|nr:Pollen-specific leucine-rich repeat extensin-like protein [Musa troglodytarum]
MALPGPYSGVSTLAFVARASAVTFGLVYGSVKLSCLQAKAKWHKKAEAKAPSNTKVVFVAPCQLLALSEKGDLHKFEFDVEIDIAITNPRLCCAYVGHDVCDYHNVFCTTTLDDTLINVIVSVDLNDVNIVGYLPIELDLLIGAASSISTPYRFCGLISQTISCLKLHELDASNNRFVGLFLDIAHRLRTSTFDSMTSRKRSSIRSSTPYS